MRRRLGGVTPPDKTTSKGEFALQHHTVLRVASKLLMPFILLFGLYVQFHGDFGPGGGFQAGVIFGAGLILYGLIFGVESLDRVVHPEAIRFLTGAGVFLYASVGVWSLLAGGNYLDYDVLATNPIVGQHVGILLIELGVGTTVAAVMVALFGAFAKRGQA